MNSLFCTRLSFHEQHGWASTAFYIPTVWQSLPLLPFLARSKVCHAWCQIPHLRKPAEAYHTRINGCIALFGLRVAQTWVELTGKFVSQGSQNTACPVSPVLSTVEWTGPVLASEPSHERRYPQAGWGASKQHLEKDLEVLWIRAAEWWLEIVSHTLFYSVRWLRLNITFAMMMI